MPMDIRPDDLSGPEIRAFLAAHRQAMLGLSRAESVHALDLAGLQHPGVSVWSVWSGPELLGCGALKELDPVHGELKAMRTASAHRRQGVAQALLQHLLGEARARGYQRLSLETGAQAAFEPARRLYARFGFTPCPPFDGYTEDPHSVFMTRLI